MSIYYHYKLGALKKAKNVTVGSPKKIFLSLLILLLVALGSSYMWYKASLRPAGEGEAKSFVVSKGDSVNEILDRLKSENLIRSSLALKIHAKLNGTYTNLKVGKYSISADLSGPEIVEIISGGKVSNSKLTILAGKTVEELLPVLNQHFGEEQVQQVMDTLTTDFHPILADQADRASVNLEGYLLPETYTDLNGGVTFESWLKRNFDLYTERIAELKESFTARGLNTHEAFTLASIVQQESSNPEQQKQIAQVFELRLARGISLGADPTFIYAAKLNGVEPKPSIESPYNTRIVKGLPPTPIGTFEMSALEAVANPAPGEFLFFVAGDDGNIYYNFTEEEHQADIRDHCQELCSLF
jgi:UPF0755 protein